MTNLSCEHTDRLRLRGPVNLAVMFAITVQAAGVLLWVGSASNRLTRLEHDRMTALDGSVRLARLEEQMVQMRRQLDRIENRVAARRDGDGQ